MHLVLSDSTYPSLAENCGESDAFVTVLTTTRGPALQAEERTLPWPFPWRFRGAGLCREGRSVSLLV